MYTVTLLEDIKSNRFNYDDEAQERDIRLMYKYLKFKYNTEEFKDIIIKLENNIKDLK